MDDSIDNKQAGQTQSHLVWPPGEQGDPWIVPPRPQVSRRVGAPDGDEGVGRVGHLATSATVVAAVAADPCRATVGRFSWSASRGDLGDAGGTAEGVRRR